MNFIKDETPQKLRGGYYTDPDIAAYLLRWVLEGKPESILEPSCGDGRFINALYQKRPKCLRSLTAFEINRKEAEKARTLTSQFGKTVSVKIYIRDFLGWVLDNLSSPPQFDAVVGNPPFIRYQYLDDSLQQRAERLIRSFGLRFTKHTNSWVPFVISAIHLLRPGGRMAMVVPSEILHVLHAQSARQFLLDQCSRILILDPEEIWFTGTLQGVVLLFAEKGCGDTDGKTNSAELAITRIRGREFLTRTPSWEFEQASFVLGSSLPAKWMFALLSDHERMLLDNLSSHPNIKRFSPLASVTVGIVTGANKFFLVPDEVVDQFDLYKFAYPMFGRSEHVLGVIYDNINHTRNKARGLPTNFLWFDGTQRKQLPPLALRYIETGEGEELHKRFKCRIRDPWYVVPSVFKAPVAMLKRCHDYPRLILNTLGAYTTDTAYRIFPKVTSPRMLVYAFVNSLTSLSAEVEGRHYGGGVLELIPSEIKRLLIPLPPVESEFLDRLDHVSRARLPASDILTLQDNIVLGALGLSPGEQDSLRNAWCKLRDRRQRVTNTGKDKAEKTTVVDLST